MSIIAALWQGIETQYNNGTFPTDQLEKIDELVFSDDIENIRNGLTLLTTIAPEYLCRYLKLAGDSVVLREDQRWGLWVGILALINSVKANPIWEELYESGTFTQMERQVFLGLHDLLIEDMAEGEKAFCVRMAKEMVRISAGEFMMGTHDKDEDADDDERSRHKVILTRDFMIGKYPVTQALWESVMSSNPSRFKGANRPVEQVSWFDVVEFCNKLSEKEGLESVYTINGNDVTCNWSSKGYRLPTEAEWEYSARGGEYHKYSGSEHVDEVAWHSMNSGRETHLVGQKKPNGFGLHDMSGNVWEWCWDCKGEYSTQDATNPIGPQNGQYRVYRGGGWRDIAKFVRVSYRACKFPIFKYYGLGLRLTRNL